MRLVVILLSAALAGCVSTPKQTLTDFCEIATGGLELKSRSYRTELVLYDIQPHGVVAKHPDCEGKVLLVGFRHNLPEQTKNLFRTLSHLAPYSGVDVLTTVRVSVDEMAAPADYPEPGRPTPFLAIEEIYSTRYPTAGTSQ